MNKIERRMKNFIWVLVGLDVAGQVLAFGSPWFVLMGVPLGSLVIFLLTVK